MRPEGVDVESERAHSCNQGGPFDTWPPFGHTAQFAQCQPMEKEFWVWG
jgi:hypothetical protein